MKKLRTEIEGPLDLEEISLSELVHYISNHPGDNSLFNAITSTYSPTKIHALLETAALHGAIRNPFFRRLESDYS